MSLFPAYSKADKKCETPLDGMKGESTNWLENHSYYKVNDDLLEIQNRIQITGKFEYDKIVGYQSSDDEDKQIPNINERQYKDDGGEDENENENENQNEDNVEDGNVRIQLEFSGNEEFYIDKTKAKRNNSIDTLKKPACPIYHVVYKMPLSRRSQFNEIKSMERYYRCKEIKKYLINSNNTNEEALNPNEYSLQMKLLNRKTMESCTDLKAWLDIIQLQDKNPYKWSHLSIAEKKLDYIHKALHYVPKNHKLYYLFIEVVNATYPSHDATKMLENLLIKDPYCFLLWQSLIITTQCTMATCTVPAVLQLYQKCMRKMHNNTLQISDRDKQLQESDDAVMLQLFYNLALFLQQAGLYEKFFAIVKLALELNVPNAVKICQGLNLEPQVETILLEYEELILKSGLPMNEIWLRIEKLRSGFIFLPFPGDNELCSDPQRIVFNEDVCQYVYPLKSKENSYHLLLIILKLLKLPFIETDCLAEHFYEETDAVEEILVAFLNHNTQLHVVNGTAANDFRHSLYELAKELSMNPTYFINSLAKEIYTQCLRNFILNCAAVYENLDERKRLTFLLLWCRFERILLILHNIGNKLTPDYIKQGRNRFKDLMKRKTNRNVLYLYSELALYELEANTPAATIEKIFTNLIDAYEDDQNYASEMCDVYVTYAEILINWGRIDQASIILSSYALGMKLENNQQSMGNTRKLSAVKALYDRLETTIKIEETVQIVILEQHLLPDYTVSLLKAYMLLQYTINQKSEGLSYLDKLLTIFKANSTNLRHRFLREKIFQIYTFMLNLFDGNNSIPASHVQQQMYTALQEYPRNIYILQTWITLNSIPWYKLRAGILKLKITMTSIVFIIAAAHHRFLKNITSLEGNSIEESIVDDVEYKKSVVRQRLLNLFSDLLQITTTTAAAAAVVTETDTTISQQSFKHTLKSNALFWRCYLRCLSDRKTSFENSKKCLLSALDECSWNKALYLDGVTHVPQEYSHLLDLIIEKQLRIYSIPEELEILRENS